MYFRLARSGKTEKYTPLVNVLVQLGYKVKLHVLCLDSLRTIMKQCGSIVRKICRDRSKAKNVLNWCSVPNIVGAINISTNTVKLVVR